MAGQAGRAERAGPDLISSSIEPRWFDQFKWCNLKSREFFDDPRAKSKIRRKQVWEVSHLNTNKSAKDFELCYFPLQVQTEGIHRLVDVSFVVWCLDLVLKSIRRTQKLIDIKINVHANKIWNKYKCKQKIKSYHQPINLLV